MQPAVLSGKYRESAARPLEIVPLRQSHHGSGIRTLARRERPEIQIEHSIRLNHQFAMVGAEVAGGESRRLQFVRMEVFERERQTQDWPVGSFLDVLQHGQRIDPSRKEDAGRLVARETLAEYPLIRRVDRRDAFSLAAQVFAVEPDG